MKRKQYLSSIAAAFCMIVLIFDSKTALTGAQHGIELCIKTVIPSLFPFFVCSILLTDTLDDRSHPFQNQLAKFLRIPHAAVPVLIPAFLGGYPVGAQCVGNLYRKGFLDKSTAQRLLAFCNNAGPSFLFGMVSQFFPAVWMVWLLWFIHIGSAFLTSRTIPLLNTYEEPIPLNLQTDVPENPLLKAARVMVSVCCWVVLFRTGIAIMRKWFLWMFPVSAQVLLTGFLELTNGCCNLDKVDNIPLRFILCSCMLAFGGFCVFLQTASVTQGLSLRCYFWGKLIQTVFSFLLSCIVMTESGLLWLLCVFPFFIFVRKVQNKYSIPRTIPV